MVSKSKFARRKPRRRKAFLDQRKRFLVFAEGEVTEREYFEDLARRYRQAVVVEVDRRTGDPKKLVELAAERLKEAKRNARKERDDNIVFDEVWCVYDIDDHKRVPDARQQARDNGIKIAVSNPCFELWGLLHYQDQTAEIARQDLASRLRKHVKGYKKHLPLDELAERYEQARDRAVALDGEWEELGEPGKNPSTGVYRLVERLRTTKE